VQLLENLIEQARLCHAIGHSVVLHMSTQMGDDALVLRGPEDKVVTQEH
jgi:hypothetical protein